MFQLCREAIRVSVSLHYQHQYDNHS